MKPVALAATARMRSSVEVGAARKIVSRPWENEVSHHASASSGTRSLIMVPLIALSSTQKDFLQIYPKAKMLDQIPVNNFVGKLRYIVFEVCYGFDFVSIEFFFRGFLILSLMNICGMHCIVPVACFYCSIHLGKPMGEAISSFFGGSLLGIIAYNTGSVWGGLIVHLGIAWMMEIGGWIGIGTP